MKAEGPEHLRFLQLRQLCNIHKASSHQWLCRWILNHETDSRTAFFHRPVVRSQISGCCHGDWSFRCLYSTAGHWFNREPVHLWSRTDCSMSDCFKEQLWVQMWFSPKRGGDPSHICKIWILTVLILIFYFFRIAFIWSYFDFYVYICSFFYSIFNIGLYKNNWTIFPSPLNGKRDLVFIKFNFISCSFFIFLCSVKATCLL